MNQHLTMASFEGALMRSGSLLLLALANLALCPNTGFGMEANAIFKQGDPSVVVVIASDGRTESLNSGVIVAAEDVVTTCRAVERATKITVVQGNVKRSGRLRFQDSARELCQLRLDDAFPAGKAVTSFVPSKELEVGQQVFAISSPRGLEHTISRGIISALRASPDETAKLVQMDAAISPGSSGGGVFDQDGRLVGVIAFGFKDAQNLNFALPTDWIAELSTRNRDRLIGTKGADGRNVQGAASDKESAQDEKLAWLPKVGDRWRYALTIRGRTLKTVTVEILEVNPARVRERITVEGHKAFLADRDVDTAFKPTRFQPDVVLPGGYQLAELAPYFAPDTDFRTGQSWEEVPGEFKLAHGAGKRTLYSNVKVVGREKVRVPAGEYDAWKIETTSATTFYEDFRITMRGAFWYAPRLLRTVKMELNLDWSSTNGTGGVEAYELISFDPAK